MRHLTAVQIDGGWRYASLGRRGGGPIGNCATGHLHDTELEARECYAAYQREQVRLRRGNLSSWSGCQVEGCDQPTKNAATAGAYDFAALCDEHLTHEVACEVLGLNQPAGDSWQS